MCLSDNFKVQQDPQYGTGERIVNAIGKVIIAVVVVPIAWVIRLFKRK
jgi:hypothetical protein